MTGPPPFRIVRPLGRGGMAAVFEVALPDDPRRLAAKVLATRSPTARERFRREGEVLARLRHPHVVAVHGAGELDDGRPYLLLDLVEGRTLAEHLAARGPLPVDEALRLTAEVTAALAAAHAIGVVHRDVKPDNVLVDADGRARLTDFGIALALDQERLTRTGQWAGTLHYMAPEQLSGGGRVGPAADVYAVGALLYELLAGERPLDGDDVHQLAVAISTREPPPLRGRRPDAPPAVAALVHRCLEKDPRARHPDAAALLVAVEALAAGRRPSASISAVALGVRRALRRRAARVAAAVALLAALGAAGAASLAVTHRGREALAAAAQAEALARDLAAPRGRGRLLDEAEAALARCEAARARTSGDAARRLDDATAALRAAWTRALALEDVRTLQRGPGAPAPEALARARARWTLVAPTGDDVEVEAARAWLLLTCGDVDDALEAARRAGDHPRGAWLRAWAAARRGDADAALAEATGDDLRAELALALGRLAPEAGRSRLVELREARARVEALRARGGDRARSDLLELVEQLDASAADRGSGSSATRALTLLAAAAASLALERDAAAAAAAARAVALVGPDPGVPATPWPVLGARTLLHPATAAALGEAEARAWLLDGEAALAAARAAADRAALDHPRALLAARLLEADALDLLDRPDEAEVALQAAARSPAPDAAAHVARARARAAARRGEAAAGLEPAARAADALALGWAELAAATYGTRSPAAGTPAHAAGLVRARRAARLAIGGGLVGADAWTALGTVHLARGEVAAAAACAERAAVAGPATWRLEVLRAGIAPAGPERGRLALLALERAAREAPRPLERAADVMAAFRGLGFGDPAAHGPAAAAQLERVSQLALELPIRPELALHVDEQLARSSLDPERRDAAAARQRARRELIERLAPLRALARREGGTQLQDPATPARLAELLRLDPAVAQNYRDYYTVHGQFAPGGFDAQALAFELEPPRTLWDLGHEADRLTRDRGIVGQVVHGATLADQDVTDAALPLRRDDDLRMALGAVHAVDLRKPVDSPTRLRALDAAARLVRRRPTSLAAWLLLGRARLELGHDPHGALAPLLLTATLPEPYEDQQRGWDMVGLFHAAEAHAALDDWEAACARLDEAARLGWRVTDRARRSRWLGRDPLPRPLDELLRRIDRGE